MRRRRIPRRIRGPGLPWKSFFALVGGLFSLVVVFGVGLDFVSDRVSLRAALIAREQSVLLDEVTQLEERNSHLSERVAVLERAQQIDNEAQFQLQHSYAVRQKEIKALNAELAFYRAVIDPKKHTKGVFVHSASFRPTGKKQVFSYQIVLSQSPKKRYRIEKGAITFFLEGKTGGRSRRLSLAQVSTAELEQIPYSFKYFQSINGQVQLPEGFLPSQFVLETNTKDSGKKSTEYKQPWSHVLGLASKGD